MTFQYVIAEAVAEILFALKAPERLHLTNAFRQIASNPYRRPDFIVREPGERDLQVAVFGRWRISYWVDHYAREVRITDIRLAKRERPR